MSFGGFGFNGAQGSAALGFCPAQGIAPWTPASLSSLVDWWDPASEYCTTDAGVDLEVGSTQYLTKASPTFTPTNKMTIRLSWKPESVAAFNGLATRFDGSDHQFYLTMMNTGRLRLYVASSSTDTSNLGTGDTVLSAGTNYEIVVVYDGTQSTSSDRIAIYVDGSAETVTETGTIPDTLRASSQPLEVGGRSAAGQNADGILQNVRISSQALSGAALTAAHTPTFHADMSAARQADWDVLSANLCESSGPRIDSAGVNNLTAVNAPGYAAGPASGPCQNLAPILEAAGAENSETFDQATSANQLLWLEDADGSGNPGFDGDGVGRYAVLTDTVSQPFTLAALVRFDAAGDALFGGDVSGEYVGRGASDWESAWGSTLADGTPDGNWHRLIAVVNGASSSIYIDGTEVASGDCGAGGYSQLVLGAKGDASAPLDGRIAWPVVAASAASAGDVANLDTWLAGKQ